MWWDRRTTGDWYLLKIKKWHRVKRWCRVEWVDNALEDLTLKILEGVKTGNNGNFETTDHNVSSGYYVVKWTSKPYTLQENT